MDVDFEINELSGPLPECLGKLQKMKEFDVKVTAILPGATFTSSFEGTDLPEERFMKPEDVAEAVYAASSLSFRACVEELTLRPQLGDL